jgi:hypothetical protein
MFWLVGSHTPGAVRRTFRNDRQEKAEVLREEFSLFDHSMGMKPGYFGVKAELIA